MRTTIDGAGRLVVPKRLRERMALPSGGEVELLERDGVIEIRPVLANVRVTSRDGKPVAEAEDVPPLTDDIVRATLDQMRR